MRSIVVTPMDGLALQGMVKALITDVRRRAQSALSESPIYVLRDVQVDRDGEVLVLSGRVDTFYHKQLAQEVVRGIAKDADVVNTIHVN